jgi:hypothetical protein
MIGVFLIALLAVYNARLAKRIGLSGFGWGVLTVLSFIFTESILGAFLVAMKYKGNIAELTDPEKMKVFIENNSIIYWSMLAFGVGGGLLVRYILEKKEKRNQV